MTSGIGNRKQASYGNSPQNLRHASPMFHDPDSPDRGRHVLIRRHPEVPLRDELGVGRFVKIGIPHPEIMAPFVGVCEIVCGALLIFGLLTRLAAIPMIINISVAILSTKIPLLLGRGFWMFICRRRRSPRIKDVGSKSWCSRKCINAFIE